MLGSEDLEFRPPWGQASRTWCRDAYAPSAVNFDMLLVVHKHRGGKEGNVKVLDVCLDIRVRPRGINDEDLGHHGELPFAPSELQSIVT